MGPRALHLSAFCDVFALKSCRLAISSIENLVPAAALLSVKRGHLRTEVIQARAGEALGHTFCRAEADRQRRWGQFRRPLARAASPSHPSTHRRVTRGLPVHEKGLWDAYRREFALTSGLAVPRSCLRRSCPRQPSHIQEDGAGTNLALLDLDVLLPSLIRADKHLINKPKADSESAEG